MAWCRAQAGQAALERKPGALIISYPKSGRTWLRVLLGKALCPQPRPCHRLLLDTPLLTAGAGAICTDFDHDGTSLRNPVHHRRLSKDKPEYRDKKVVFLARDVRDVLVSSYFEATRRSDVFRLEPCRFDGTLAEFVRSPVLGAKKVAAFYEIWSRNSTVPEEFLLIRYEQLHTAPQEVLTVLLRFIGATDVDRRDIAAAIRYASFENMRKLERADEFADPRLRPGDMADPESFKVRRGAVGGYVDYLSERDVLYIDRELRRRGSPFVAPSERPSP